ETYNNYVDRYEQAKSRYDELKQQRENKIAKRKATDRFISELSKREELLTEFDNCLWLTVIDKVTVRNGGTLVFRFNDGTEIEG
ncbi:MAG: recombinase family protein, partial [Clostridia bacterium]|nr:recombinase family protein [Clostridia bacterium]